MPTPRELRQRIASIRNTQKITKAMEMVASVKFRKARLRIVAARPYALKLSQLAARLRSDLTKGASALFAERAVHHATIAVVSGDKGLCGSFNANVMKMALDSLAQQRNHAAGLTIIGKKANDYFKRRPYSIIDSYTAVFANPRYEDVARIGEKLLERFVSGATDLVTVVYTEFKGAGAQRPRIEQLLPIPDQDTHPDGRAMRADYLYEPSAEDLVDDVLAQYVTFQIWRMVLESFAAEQAARMAAMSAATKNAGELIEKLTLYYNKVRQGSITKELLEVVAGADALK
jgi:F-type H+-transporting ATPase subunit gamma